jgi:hypothetical protein
MGTPLSQAALSCELTIDDLAGPCLKPDLTNGILSAPSARHDAVFTADPRLFNLNRSPSSPDRGLLYQKSFNYWQRARAAKKQP